MGVEREGGSIGSNRRKRRLRSRGRGRREKADNKVKETEE
jgi:hypothetical protein